MLPNPKYTGASPASIDPCVQVGVDLGVTETSPQIGGRGQEPHHWRARPEVQTRYHCLVIGLHGERAGGGHARRRGAPCGGQSQVDSQAVDIGASTAPPHLLDKGPRREVERLGKRLGRHDGHRNGAGSAPRERVHCSEGNLSCLGYASGDVFAQRARHDRIGRFAQRLDLWIHSGRVRVQEFHHSAHDLPCVARGQQPLAFVGLQEGENVGTNGFGFQPGPSCEGHQVRRKPEHDLVPAPNQLVGQDDERLGVATRSDGDHRDSHAFSSYPTDAGRGRAAIP